MREARSRHLGTSWKTGLLGAGVGVSEMLQQARRGAPPKCEMRGASTCLRRARVTDRDIPALWVRAFTPNGGRGKGEAGPWMEGKARKATHHFFKKRSTY